MADLPTEADLEQLYQERGHDALVWYAWRNALRVLSLLGRRPLSKIWKTYPVRHSYAVIRISLLLGQWPNRVVERSPIFRAAAAAARAAAYDDARVARVAARTAAYTDTADAYIYAYDDAADAAATAADAADAATAAAYIYAYDAAAAARAAAATAAARADFNDLKHAKNWQWLEQALWPKKWFGSSKPKEFSQYEENLLNDLKQLGLDFLADDLQCLWEGKPLGEHAVNYFTDFSEVITNDPLLLRRAILYGENAEQIQAVRVLLLGSGGAGKTTLAKRLKDEEHSAELQVATLGIDYQQHKPIRLHETLPQLNLAPNLLELYLWDFGGQTIFHGLHRAFLHENCVYVLVVDNRHEQAPEEWLYQIRHLAGSQAKVLLVTNEYENCHARQNKTRLLREFGDLLAEESFFYFSCVQPELEAFKQFVEVLIQACLDSRRSIFSSTMRLQRQLAEQYQQQVFLHESKVEQLATKQNIEATSAIQQLIQLGFLVRVKSGGLQYCLKPAWAVDNAYKFLHAELIMAKAGTACIRTLNTVLGKDVEPEHIEYLAEFLNERELCCLLPNQNYFFPDAAPPDEPAIVKQLLNTQPSVVLRFDLPYLPLGFHARLVHQLFNENLEVAIKQTQAIWRHGFILSSPEAKALVEYQLRKASIELVLIGRVAEFARLFQAFYTALKYAVVNNRSITERQIYLSLLFNEQPFSIDSSLDLLVALKQARTVNDLSEELSKVTGKNIHVSVGDHSQVAIDAQHVTQKQHTDNTTVEINQDQRQQLAVLMDELLKTQPKGKELVAIGTVQEALENPEAAQSKTLLSKVWTGTKELGIFTKETVLPILEKKDLIMGAVTAAVAAASSLM